VRRCAGDEREAGFALLEVIVSLAVITTIMAAVGSFFISSTRLTHRQGLEQGAAQLARDGLETARGLKGPALLEGRAECVTTCPDAAATGAEAYLTETERWDLASDDGATPILPRPDTPTQIVLGGTTYSRHWYIGRCWQAVTGGPCQADSTKPVPLVRVVVAVTWPGADCASTVCSHVTSELFSANPKDPVFRVGL
jgi:type II secretory pathway pseudopilin PulG